MEDVRCHNCGFPIGTIVSEFESLKIMYRRNIYEASKETTKKPNIINKINEDKDNCLEKIFNELSINRYCCRQKLTTYIVYHDLYTM